MQCFTRNNSCRFNENCDFAKGLPILRPGFVRWTSKMDGMGKLGEMFGRMWIWRTKTTAEMSYRGGYWTNRMYGFTEGNQPSVVKTSHFCIVIGILNPFRYFFAYKIIGNVAATYFWVVPGPKIEGTQKLIENCIPIKQGKLPSFRPIFPQEKKTPP